MTTLATERAPVLSSLTDDELAGAWTAADVDDPAVFATFMAEFDQRAMAERAARMHAGRDAVLAEGYDAAYAQYGRAADYCRGRMLSALGRKRVTDEMSLWTGSEETAWRYASEELQAFWTWIEPRISPGKFARQRGAQMRIEHERWIDRDEIKGDVTDEHCRDGNDGPGLAGDEPGALRHEETTPGAPQAGPGSAVDRGRPDHDSAGTGREDPGTDGGPGGPVHPGRVGGSGMGDDGPRRPPTFDEIPDDDDATEGGTRAKTFDQVEEIDQEWLWPGMIPSGLLTVVFGPPKASKTTLAIDYAARVSRGDVNPDGTSLGPAAPVLLGALEDISESSTIKKLKGAKADLSKVVDISRGPNGDGLELELDHVAWLHEVAAEHPGVALIVIDTLSNSANKSINTRPALKAMLKPLADLAANTGAAVILTCHSLKGHDDIPEGGRSLVSIPRMVLQISKSQTEPGVRTLSVYASNVASDSGEGYRYKVIEDGAASRLEWCWDAVRTGPGPEATGQNRILLLLRNSEEPLSAQLIAAKTGINYAVTRVLLSRMKKRGDVVQAEERGTWTVPGADEQHSPEVAAINSPSDLRRSC